MQQFGLANIRNVALLAHSSAGKTTFTEAALVTAGIIKRQGRIEEGTTVSDFDPDEIKRQISINLTVIPCEWNNSKINLLDTPGYSDFVGEVKSGLRVSEGVAIVICAASGVEVGSEQSWSYCEEADLPRLIFINKMDRDNADFTRTVSEIRAKLASKCIPIQFPIGSQKNFQGFVDLISRNAYGGSKMEAMEIPDIIIDQVNTLHEQLVEAVAENDDQLLEKYLEVGELSLEELRIGLKNATKKGELVPILVGSALQNIGTHHLLNAMIEYLPSPEEEGIRTLRDSVEETIPSNEQSSVAALIFKTSADPYVGKLTYFRIYNGILDSNSQVWNVDKGETERIAQLYIVRGKNQEAISQLRAGDIGAVAKLNVSTTGDTLTVKESPIKIVPIQFPEPVFSKAVYPKTKADLDKMGGALSRLVEEDPSLRIQRDVDTGETILSGLGETHLDVTVDKLQRKFGVSVLLELPKVPYKETITMQTQAEYKHKKQSGGHGQYGHVFLEIEPLPRGSGTEFANRVVGGTIPRNYIPAVEKGVNEALHDGVLAKYPVVDIKATVYDGSFHPVDSSEICFKIAGAGALRKGLNQAQPILLEPIMNIRITVPEDFTGDIISDLNSRRARMQGMIPQGNLNVIEAQAPLAEIQRYTIDLKSITQGRGSYTAVLSHYEEVPAHITEKIVAHKRDDKN